MDLEQCRQHLTQEHERLEQLRSQFRTEHLTDESESENLSELSHQAQHQADMGTETFDRERDLSLLEQVEAELADIEHALRRIDDGSYGRCEACNQAIDEARLEAVPAARFCLADQAVAEREARSTSS